MDPDFWHKEVLRVSSFEEKSKTPEQQKQNSAIVAFPTNSDNNGTDGSAIMRVFSS